MDDSNVESAPPPAFKSLRSRFEQLAATASTPDTSSPQKPSSSFGLPEQASSLSSSASPSLLISVPRRPLTASGFSSVSHSRNPSNNTSESQLRPRVITPPKRRVTSNEYSVADHNLNANLAYMQTSSGSVGNGIGLAPSALGGEQQQQQHLRTSSSTSDLKFTAVKRVPPPPPPPRSSNLGHGKTLSTATTASTVTRQSPSPTASPAPTSPLLLPASTPASTASTSPSRGRLDPGIPTTTVVSGRLSAANSPISPNRGLLTRESSLEMEGEESLVLPSGFGARRGRLSNSSSLSAGNASSPYLSPLGLPANILSTENEGEEEPTISVSSLRNRFNSVTSTSPIAHKPTSPNRPVPNQHARETSASSSFSAISASSAAPSVISSSKPHLPPRPKDNSDRPGSSLSVSPTDPPPLPPRAITPTSPSPTSGVDGGIRSAASSQVSLQYQHTASDIGADESSANSSSTSLSLPPALPARKGPPPPPPSLQTNAANDAGASTTPFASNASSFNENDTSPAGLRILRPGVTWAPNTHSASASVSSLSQPPPSNVSLQSAQPPPPPPRPPPRHRATIALETNHDVAINTIPSPGDLTASRPPLPTRRNTQAPTISTSCFTHDDGYPAQTHTSTAPAPPPPPPRLPARPTSLIPPTPSRPGSAMSNNPISPISPTYATFTSAATAAYPPPALNGYPANGTMTANNKILSPSVARLPPPPTRMIGLNDKLPPARRPQTSSDDEYDDEGGAGGGGGGGGGGVRHGHPSAGATAAATQSFPDSSCAYRRAPVVSFRDRPSSMSRADEQNEKKQQKKRGVYCSAYSGSVLLSGAQLLVSSSGASGSGGGSGGGGGGGSDKPGVHVYNFTISDGPVRHLDSSTAKDVGLKELKVTAMEVKPVSSPSSGAGVKQHHHFHLPHFHHQAADPGDARGHIVWLGTKEGHLVEMDIRTGTILGTKFSAHLSPVTHIFRHARSMVTVDELGKVLVFSPDAEGQGEDVSLSGYANAGALNGATGGAPAAATTGAGGGLGKGQQANRVVRIQEKVDWVKVIKGKLWTATRGDQQDINGGPASSAATGPTAPGASSGKVPVIKVYDLGLDGPSAHASTSATVSLAPRLITPTEHVGPVTCATLLPCDPDRVYVGHEGGYVSIWTLVDPSTSTTAKPTPLAVPACIEVLKVSTSDILCLEGVHDRLWAGSRNGMITVYDLAGAHRPWMVTNAWMAHPGLPVLKLAVDVWGIEKAGKLSVISVGRDEQVRVWDGLLGNEWIDSEMSKQEQSFTKTRDMTVLMVSWNVDAAKPDTLTGDPANVNFLNDVLRSVDSPPDVISFGFQEVMDLENRKMAAKNVLLTTAGSSSSSNTSHSHSSSKKKLYNFARSGGHHQHHQTDRERDQEDEERYHHALSDKVTSAYKKWYERLVAAVRQAWGAATPDGGYSVIHTESLVGLFSCIFVRTSERPKIRDAAVATVKRGMGGMYGNKGGIVARLVVDDTSICLINCHLAAGQHAVRQRNSDVAGILEEKAVLPVGEHDLGYVRGGDGSMVMDHELVFINGDLNYRIDHRRDAIVNAVRNNDIETLLGHDQLLREMKFNRACRLRGFTEGPITFAPTYKYDRRSNEYDTSEKRRSPAWCDRILWRVSGDTPASASASTSNPSSSAVNPSHQQKKIQQLHYRRYEANVSDHRPISAAFRVKVKSVDYEGRERVREEVQKRWMGEQLKRLTSLREFYMGQAII